MPTRPAFARIDGIVARKANIAVVFRRGPTLQTQMLLWNLDTDELTPGQWIKGRMFPESCDLSPDGRLLVAMLGDWTNRQGRRDGTGLITGAYTTISRPPYFTALAVSVHGTTHSGGGLWRTNHQLELFASLAHLEIKAKLPRRIKISEFSNTRCHMLAERLCRGGWIRKRSIQHVRLDPDSPNFQDQVAEIRKHLDLWEKMSSQQLDELTSRPGPSLTKDLPLPAIYVRPTRGGILRWRVGDREIWEALDSNGTPVLSFPSNGTSNRWLDLDHRGRVIYGDRGCLWAWADFPKGEPKLVADLNTHTFIAVEPPAWALGW